MANSVSFGQVIKESRQRAGMTVEYVAREIPANPRTVFRYEEGKHVGPDIIARLAEIFRDKELIENYCRDCPARKVRLKKKSRLGRGKTIFSWFLF